MLDGKSFVRAGPSWDQVSFALGFIFRYGNDGGAVACPLTSGAPFTGTAFPSR